MCKAEILHFPNDGFLLEKGVKFVEFCSKHSARVFFCLFVCLVYSSVKKGTRRRPAEQGLFPTTNEDNQAGKSLWVKVQRTLKSDGLNVKQPARSLWMTVRRVVQPSWQMCHSTCDLRCFSCDVDFAPDEANRVNKKANKEEQNGLFFLFASFCSAKWAAAQTRRFWWWYCSPKWATR